MYESDIQSEVSSEIIQGETNKVNLAITDNGNAVIVETQQSDAAYTADEARELAQSLKCVSDQRWKGDNDDVVEYIRDLADVVDGELSDEDFQSKWQGRGLEFST